MTSNQHRGKELSPSELELIIYFVVLGGLILAVVGFCKQCERRQRQETGRQEASRRETEWNRQRRESGRQDQEPSRVGDSILSVVERNAAARELQREASRRRTLEHFRREAIIRAREWAQVQANPTDAETSARWVAQREASRQRTLEHFRQEASRQAHQRGARITDTPETRRGSSISTQREASRRPTEETSRQQITEQTPSNQLQNLSPQDRKDFVSNILSRKKYSAPKDDSSLNTTDSSETHEEEHCAICLEVFNEGNTICTSNNQNCRHFFHRNCVGEWLLAGNADCPVCRRDYLSFESIRSIDGQSVLASQSVRDIETGATSAPLPSATPASQDASLAPPTSQGVWSYLTSL